MKTQLHWLAFFFIAVGICEKFSTAGFDFNLTIQGRGIVRVQDGPMTKVYSSTPSSPVSVLEDSVTLSAIPLGFTIDDAPDSVAVPIGSNVFLNLGTTLGSKFVNWTGPLVPDLDPQDPDYQNPFDGSYDLSNPNSSEVLGIAANFQDDQWSQIQFRFKNSDPWSDVSQWNFTGDDDINAPPSSSGFTEITLTWSDMLPFLVPDQVNRVDLWIKDSQGREKFDSFDLTVFSPSSVPEPSSFALVLLSGLGCFKFRKNGRRFFRKR